MTPEIRATYRVQLQPGLGFAAAASLSEYLCGLGVTHLYVSPCLQAVPGSTHGYDVVDHSRANQELGGEEEFGALCRTLEAARLGLVLDIVPNHMAIPGRENAWWWDVLENGPSSRWAAYFDVDWEPPEARLRNVVLLPVLGDHYGRILEAGELRVVRDGADFSVRYHEHAFPVAPRSLDTILADAAERCGSEELAFIAEGFGALPLATATDEPSVRQRHRDKEVLRGLLRRLLGENAEAGVAVDSAVRRLNEDVDALDVFLGRQNYRVARWRTAGRDLGYRRFFDINGLIGLRMENESVFRDTHARIIEWYEEGRIAGLRIDHPDGLRNPGRYLQRLRRSCPHAWIVVEKILMPGERLADDWPVAGTTGYDFLNLVGGLFVDAAVKESFDRIYADFVGERVEWEELVREKKRLVLRDVLGADLNRLTELFLNVCERHRRQRDYTRHELHEALREVCVSFPVYRTYVQAASGRVRSEDQRIIEQAIDEARTSSELDDVLDFLRDILLLRVPGELESELVMRFQQLTSPVMAKGVEDTAIYCFNRFVARNEVGGEPEHFATPLHDFHTALTSRQQHEPSAMLATSTHDTKRSEDVRARLYVLSEIPEQWARALHRLSSLGQRHRTDEQPDRNAEYLLYQTLVGAWPIEPARVHAYMEKAAREAKSHTSWTDQDPAYENALHRFIDGVLGDAEIVAELESLVEQVRLPGRVNSLAQTLIKLTAPGIPDLYQGSELWDLSLVDPDNRRPVDWALRRTLLPIARDAPIEEVMARMDEGLPKLRVIERALRLRAERPGAFGPGGEYEPLDGRGPCAEHVVAFVRGGEAITIAPRLTLRRGAEWRDTVLDLPPGTWVDQMTDARYAAGPHPMAELLSRFPVALLAKESVRG